MTTTKKTTPTKALKTAKVRPPLRTLAAQWTATAVGVYFAAVGIWWWLSHGTQAFPPASVFPPIDKWLWIERPAWTVGTIVALIVIARVVIVAQPVSFHKYGTARWNQALVGAKLYKEDEPQATMIGRVRRVDETTLIILRLPPGLSVSQVQAKIEQVAASVDVPVEQLHLSKHEGRSGVMLVRIDPPDLPLKPRVVDPPEESSWKTPVLIGRDLRGRDVTAPTYDIGQWLVGGITGSGKTTLLRLLATHYALDPDAVIWGCDGKGSRDDWGPLRHRADRWVDVTDPDASTLYLEMLRDVAAEVTARNRAGGRDHPGMLVILEEATALRAALDPVEMKEADRHLVRIVQTCRSGNVLVVTAAQRPSATLMSTNVRAQAGVGICMNVRSMTDAEMVLGYRPEVALPDSVGRALLDVGDGKTRAVLVDHMPEQQWRDLCHLWRPLKLVPPIDDELDELDRIDEDLDELEADIVPQDAPPVDDVADPEPVDPRLAAVEIALRAAGRKMTTTELWEALPGDLRTINPSTLGKTLTAAGVHPVRSSRGMLYSLDSLPAPALLPSLECMGSEGVKGQ